MGTLVLVVPQVFVACQVEGGDAHFVGGVRTLRVAAVQPNQRVNFPVIDGKLDLEEARGMIVGRLEIGFREEQHSIDSLLVVGGARSLCHAIL